MGTRQQTYWILREDQIRCLASARRQDIVDRLADSGPASVREFASAIGLQPQAVYHHLRKLLACDLVVEAGSRTVNRRVEKLYATTAPRMRMARALGRPRFRDAIKEVVAATCRQMDRDFSAGIDSGGAVSSGSDRNLGFLRIVGAPGPATLEKINGYLDRIAELLWRKRDARAPLIAFGWTMAPVGEATKNEGLARRRKKR